MFQGEVTLMILTFGEIFSDPDLVINFLYCILLYTQKYIFQSLKTRKFEILQSYYVIQTLEIVLKMCCNQKLSYNKHCGRWSEWKNNFVYLATVFKTCYYKNFQHFLELRYKNKPFANTCIPMLKSLV